MLALTTTVTVVLVSSCLSFSCASPTPVVIWHGMGDSCCNPLSMGSIKRLVEEQIGGGVYVKSLEIGNNIVEDIENGFLLNVNTQTDMVCKQLNADTKLQNGYHAMGFSQGGQFLRAIAQRCPTPPMKNLITFGGQHQGVYGLPHCPGSNQTLCNIMRKLLNLGAYVSFVQNNLVQAEYWHDPLNEAEYRDKSVFLADINQEKTFNATYKTNLLKIKKMILVKFTQDTLVEPRESEWFGFYKPGSGSEIYNMTQSPLYQKDLLGLKVMNEGGRIIFLESPTDHLQFSNSWFEKNIIPYLKE